MPPIRPLSPTATPSPAHLNDLFRQVIEMGTSRGGLDDTFTDEGAGGVRINLPPDRILWLRLTESETGPAYSWEEVVEDENGTWAVPADGQTGAFDNYPAYEARAKTNLAVGTIGLGRVSADGSHVRFVMSGTGKRSLIDLCYEDCTGSGSGETCPEEITVEYRIYDSESTDPLPDYRSVLLSPNSGNAPPDCCFTATDSTTWPATGADLFFVSVCNNAPGQVNLNSTEGYDFELPIADFTLGFDHVGIVKPSSTLRLDIRFAGTGSTGSGSSDCPESGKRLVKVFENPDGTCTREPVADCTGSECEESGSGGGEVGTTECATGTLTVPLYYDFDWVEPDGGSTQFDGSYSAIHSSIEEGGGGICAYFQYDDEGTCFWHASRLLSVITGLGAFWEIVVSGSPGSLTVTLRVRYGCSVPGNATPTYTYTTDGTVSDPLAPITLYRLVSGTLDLGDSITLTPGTGP